MLKEYLFYIQEEVDFSRKHLHASPEQTKHITAAFDIDGKATASKPSSWNEP